MDVRRTGHLPIEASQDDEPWREGFRGEVRVETEFAVEKIIPTGIDLKAIGENTWRKNEKDHEIIGDCRSEEVVNARVVTECLSSEYQCVQRQTNRTQKEEHN